MIYKVPYVMQTVKAGKTIEVYKYFSGRYGMKNSKKKEKDHSVTSELQKKINQEHAERKLRWLINENFSPGDIHLVVTYRRECRPLPDEAIKQRTNMLRRFERVYKKLSLEFKYIAVTECENTAIHHHLILPKIDVSLLQEKWKYGRVRPTYMYSEDFKDLASYLIKETSKTFRKDGPMNKRWSASKNLRQPKIIKKIIKSRSWQHIPKAIKGYYLVKDSVLDFINASGYLTQSYTLRKLE